MVAKVSEQREAVSRHNTPRIKLSRLEALHGLAVLRREARLNRPTIRTNANKLAVARECVLGKITVLNDVRRLLRDESR